MTDHDSRNGKTGLTHSGAKLRHNSPFACLEVPALSYEESDRPLTERWVAPLYLGGLRDEVKLLNVLRPLKELTNRALIERLISLRDWRSRLVGSYLAAMRREVELTEWIGRLLLRSDVCYAGPGYCYALARINTPACTEYLAKYLKYYLNEPDLWFDQSNALAALHYLDGVNDTAEAEGFAGLWSEFVENKPTWDLERSRDSFVLGMACLERVSNELGWGRPNQQ